MHTNCRPVITRVTKSTKGRETGLIQLFLRRTNNRMFLLLPLPSWSNQTEPSDIGPILLYIEYIRYQVYGKGRAAINLHSVEDAHAAQRSGTGRTRGEGRSMRWSLHYGWVIARTTRR